MPKEPRSNRQSRHSVSGVLDLENMKVVEHLDDDEQVSHDLQDILTEYDGKEVAITVSMKEKLEGE